VTVGEKRTGSRRRWSWVVGSLLVLGGLGYAEARTSWLQARLFSTWASGISFEVQPGIDPDVWTGSNGPFDVRRGYARLPTMLPTLEARGYAVDEQARISARFRRSLELGLYPVYPEKPQAGLAVTDRQGDILFRSLHPARTYGAFDSIPAPIVQTLLFVENRELMQSDFPNRNPVVEWDRLARSLAGLLVRKLGAENARSGGSTLATQIEKYKHSPAGLTRTPRDKLSQMATATVRAYQGGPQTQSERERIVVDYLNSVPLSAVAGYGEVLGLQDALNAWFGLDGAWVNDVLREWDTADVAGRTVGGDAPVASDSAGVAFRAVLALMLSQRRPSYYLATDAGRSSLDELVDFYLTLLEDADVVDPDLLELTRGAELDFATTPPPTPSPAFSDLKAANAIRTRLLTLVGTDRLYELDRMDLTAHTTIDRTAQDSVTRLFQRLSDPEFVRASGLIAPRLLGSGDPSKVVYSFLLYEAGQETNELRVQTDNFAGPFDVNEASRLELGSTAKLRTLVTYLEVAERLHRELAPLDATARRAAVDSLGDPLTRWAAATLDQQPSMTSRELIEASMQRRYSGSPAERFFTGGGQHVFQNFDRTFDGTVLTVEHAFRNSVNLVFVRMMRDLERYYRARLLSVGSGLLTDRESDARRQYLSRFADREGTQYLSRFWTKYAKETPEGIFDALLSGRRLTPRRLAWTFRAVRPEAEEAEFVRVVRERSPDTEFTERALSDLYRMADVAPFGLADQGYLAGIHPLELWVVKYRLENPYATRSEAVAASAEARQEVYSWLFNPRKVRAQDRSISIMLEIESFLEIQRAWSRLGYPFENLVPSYGSSIGSSGDRPDALATLMGIIINDGVRLPSARLTKMEFGVDTPYETRLSARPVAGEVVLSPDVASVARAALAGVAADGTARSVRDAFVTPSGDPVVVGGKTGTGNNQYKVFGRGAGLIQTRTINRTATFVFFLGDRHFGVITAHVDGEGAAAYTFTSALPLAVLRLTAPALTHLLGEPVPAETTVVQAAPEPADVPAAAVAAGG
jgi:membrane peptidoglycan carboxypeptidase